MDAKIRYHKSLSDILLGIAQPAEGGIVYWGASDLSLLEQQAVEAHERTHVMLFRSTTFGLFQTALDIMLSAPQLSEEHSKIINRWLTISLQNSWNVQEGVASYIELYILALGNPELAERRRNSYPTEYLRALEPIEQVAAHLSIPVQARSNVIYQLGRAAMQTCVLRDITKWKHITVDDPKAYFARERNNPNVNFKALLKEIGLQENSKRLSALIHDPYIKNYIRIFGVDPRIQAIRPKKYPTDAQEEEIFEVVRSGIRTFLKGGFHFQIDPSTTAEMRSWFFDLRNDLITEGLEYLDHCEVVIETNPEKEWSKLKGEIIYHIQPHSLIAKCVGESFLQSLISVSDGYLCLIDKAIHEVAENMPEDFRLNRDRAALSIFHPYHLKGDRYQFTEECYIANLSKSGLKKVLKYASRRVTALVIVSTDFNFEEAIPFFGAGYEPCFIYIPPVRVIEIDDDFPAVGFGKWATYLTIFLSGIDAFTWLILYGMNPGICGFTPVSTSAVREFLDSAMKLWGIKSKPDNMNMTPHVKDLRTRIALARVWRYGI